MKREDQLGDSLRLVLTESFHLCRAESAEWERYCSIYYNQAVIGFFRQAGFPSLLPAGFIPCWIECDGVIAGGAAISSGAIHYLFAIPPFHVDSRLLKQLTHSIRQLAGGDQTFHAYEILTDQEDVFIRAGFRPDPHRFRWMQRPAAVFNHFINDNITLRSLETFQENGERRLLLEREIGLFLFKYTNEGASGAQEAFPFADVLIKLRQYAAGSSEDVLAASSLVYDAGTRALIGVCLIGMEACCPSIKELAVLPSFRNRGVATGMLRRALTILKKRDEPLLRIRVMHGHPLEALCSQLGFMPGPLFSSMTAN
ncbi:GNAT family N-acetyltransferase [Paenibacillus dokdonensis]|uniref:GNAT family N-acetyltransferase n=1 Tax=Paenibacillus dokdonensis TaxID=2567944 RepID=UPI0010A8186B|nr:GNAT family N-acetyltransferase [Paenibacillus dokdonensis]